VCLASVAADAAQTGARVTVVLVDGRRLEAKVLADQAQVDPEGRRLHV
jgi:glycine cleavage system aminomethyltransferase T